MNINIKISKNRYKPVCILFLVFLMFSSCSTIIGRNSDYIKIIDKTTYTSSRSYTIYDYGFIKSISENKPTTSYFLIYEREETVIEKKNGEEKVLRVKTNKHEMKVPYKIYEKYNIGDVLKLNSETNKFEIFKSISNEEKEAKIEEK